MFPSNGSILAQQRCTVPFCRAPQGCGNNAIYSRIGLLVLVREHLDRTPIDLGGGEHGFLYSRCFLEPIH